MRNWKYIKSLPTPPSQTIPHPIISTGITPNLTDNEPGNHRNLKSSGGTNSSPIDNQTLDIVVPLPPLSLLLPPLRLRNQSIDERAITRTPEIQNQTMETPTPTQ